MDRTPPKNHPAVLVLRCFCLGAMYTYFLRLFIYLFFWKWGFYHGCHHHFSPANVLSSKQICGLKNAHLFLNSFGSYRWSWATQELPKAWTVWLNPCGVVGVFVFLQLRWEISDKLELSILWDISGLINIKQLDKLVPKQWSKYRNVLAFKDCWGIVWNYPTHPVFQSPPRLWTIIREIPKKHLHLSRLPGGRPRCYATPEEAMVACSEAPCSGISTQRKECNGTSDDQIRRGDDPKSEILWPKQSMVYLPTYDYDENKLNVQVNIPAPSMMWVMFMFMYPFLFGGRWFQISPWISFFNGIFSVTSPC